MKQSRTVTKTTKLERVAELAMRLGGRHLADYSATRSRKDFTQRQLMACLILRAYCKTTYRGVVELLTLSPRLRAVLGLEEKVPHFTALQKFCARSRVMEIADAILRQLGVAALRAEGAGAVVAMDSTGMETSTASAHFMSRAGRQRRGYVKLSVMVVCGSLIPLGVVAGWGPSNDLVEARHLLPKAMESWKEVVPKQLYADAGYDAEWVHQQCREGYGVESLIAPAHCRADGSRGGRYRAAMSAEHLRARGYGRRWAVESFMSGLKRVTGSALLSRKSDHQLAEATLRVLAYAIHR